MTQIDQKSFLVKEVPTLLSHLQPDTQPSFGLMTPQHMVEHVTLITKISAKRYGEPLEEPTKGQVGFKRFIQKGAHFKHYPSDKTAADLPPLKYGTLEEAIEQIPIAIKRFYTQFEQHPGFKAYHPMMGELEFEELERFHYQHYRYHFWQFGLIGAYPS